MPNAMGPFAGSVGTPISYTVKVTVVPATVDFEIVQFSESSGSPSVEIATSPTFSTGTGTWTVIATEMCFFAVLVTKPSLGEIDLTVELEVKQCMEPFPPNPE